MAIDLYSKMESYPYYDYFEIEVVDEIEMFLQQLDILLASPPECMLGNPSFGCGLDRFLWSTHTSAIDIKQFIQQQIVDNIVFYTPIDYDIEVNFVKGPIFDSILIDVTVDSRKVAGYMINP